MAFCNVTPAEDTYALIQIFAAKAQGVTVGALVYET